MKALACARTDAKDEDPFLADVVAGLSAANKSLPARYFYDDRGSALFVKITRLAEYYQTRTELALLEKHGADMAAVAGDVRTLVEWGSGDGRKSLAVLNALPTVRAYVPLEISASAVEGQLAMLRAQRPDLLLAPVIADFMRPFDLPRGLPDGLRMGFFPGSTIGNFSPRDAVRLLENAAARLGQGAYFLLGVDLKKPLDVLLPAYDDAAGVTAAFNLNLLKRINADLGGDFDLSAWRHQVRYDADHGRIEMHLESLRSQSVRIAGQNFSFAAGETIHTENSHKFTLDEAKLMARCAGWSPAHCFVDDRSLFAVMLLRRAH